jgi:hypothetical protein
MLIFAQVGTSNVVYCAKQKFAPEGYIHVQEDCPGENYILTTEGTWLRTRESILNEIAIQKNELRDSGFLYAGKLWDSDQSARASYTLLTKVFADNPETVIQDWKASDGVWVTMDKPLFDKVFLALNEHLQLAFGWQRSREDDLKNTPDTELNTFVV